MKKLTGILFLIVSLNASSQNLLDSLANPRFTLEDSIGKRLAELATSNVDLKVIDKQIEAARYEWKTNRASLLNNISANFNLNERNIKTNNNPETNIFFPRYNFGLTLPLGNIITKPAQTKKAKAQYEEIILQKEAVGRDLRESILTAYQDYSMYKNLLVIQEEIIRDESESFDAVQQKFKNNTVTMEIFTSASRRLNETLIQRITILRNMNVAKYQVESLIGMKLEDAIAQLRRKKK
ncbi:MAG: TolC family protein [Chitinophagaceae bacterium]